MDDKKTKPRSKSAPKHPALGCIDFSSYPSEYTFTKPEPLKVLCWPQQTKPAKRRNRSRRSNSYAKLDAPDLSQPGTSRAVDPEFDRVDTARCTEPENVIINLISVTESQIDSMSFDEFVDYVSKVLSLGEEMVIKNLHDCNPNMLKDEEAFQAQTPGCSTYKVYFKETPSITVPFVSALHRLTNLWHMLKPYMEFQKNAYNAGTSPVLLQDNFMEWQTTNKRLMFYLMRRVFKLIKPTGNIPPDTKAPPYTAAESSDDSNDSESNSPKKADSYFGFNQNEKFLANEHLDRGEEDADAYFTWNNLEMQSRSRFVENQQEGERFVENQQEGERFVENQQEGERFVENQQEGERFVENQQEGERFDYFPQSNYPEANSYYYLVDNGPFHLTFEEFMLQRENERSLLNRESFFTFSPKESTDMKKWSLELLAKAEKTSGSAIPEGDSIGTSTEKPKKINKYKKNSFVVAPKTDFSIKMKNYRYPVEFTHKVKNIHLNVQELLKEDKITEINVPSTSGDQKNTTLNYY